MSIPYFILISDIEIVSTDKLVDKNVYYCFSLVTYPWLTAWSLDNSTIVCSIMWLHIIAIIHVKGPEITNLISSFNDVIILHNQCVTKAKIKTCNTSILRQPVAFHHSPLFLLPCVELVKQERLSNYGSFTKCAQSYQSNFKVL